MSGGPGETGPKLLPFGRGGGGPGRAPVVLVHGAGMDRSVWAFVGRPLAARGHLALGADLPGHGAARHLPADVAVGAMADRLAAALGVGPPVALVGHSMGALVALDLAARFPDRVARLALLGAAAAMPVHPALLEAVRAGGPRAIELIVDWGLGWRAKAGPSPTPGVPPAEAARATLRRGDPAALATDLAACDAYRDGPARAAAIRCPTLVLAGSEDRMAPPRAAEALARAMPDAPATLDRLPGVGHMAMLEAPGAVAAALARFLA